MLPTGLSSMGSHYSWVVPFYVAGSASTVGLVKSDVCDHSVCCISVTHLYSTTIRHIDLK